MDTEQTITGMSLLHNLSTSSKGKLKWTADFETLQRFVAEVLVLSDGEWTTPGRHAKLYQNESISIRWYSDTESITISADLANDEDKLVDVVEKNRSVSHYDNKSHPNNNLDDSQETYLKILNCQLQAKLQALSDQFVSSMTYINRTLSDHSNQLKELRIADKESSAVNALLTDNVNISNQDTLKRKYKSKKSNKKSKTSEKQSKDEQRCITDSPSKTTQTSQPINEVSNVNKNTTSSPKSIQSPSKKVTVVAGDSILKHVEGWRLSSASNHVVVKSFSGATTSDMEDFLRPVLRKEPNKIILHIGTNDINYQTAQTVAERVLNLGIQITYNRYSDLWDTSKNR
ncbi:Hypothetical predicted protein [Paramuricea clavata]|uniref:Uncharacterized protein n=1 Tax=Paramuricea clavata TaxID=317549 RepID=A0A7D9HQR4_PARCT|nr:Hypothetical predicted protein [Paramuricea clavata]